jgi:PAS domain S-box-containing protein
MTTPIQLSDNLVKELESLADANSQSVEEVIKALIQQKRSQEIDDQTRFKASLLDRVDQAIIAVTPDDEVIFWNRFAEELYGWSAEETIGKKTFDLMVIPQEKEVAVAIREHLHQGKTWIGEMILRDRSGRVFTVQATNSLLFDDGQMIGIVGISRDVTEQKAAREAFQRRTAQLVQAERLAQIGSYERNFRTEEVFWSEGRYHILGVNPSDGPLTRDEYESLLHPEDRTRVRQIVDEAYRLGQPYTVEYRLMRPNDGAVIYLQSIGEPIFDDKTNAHIGMRGTIRDITDLKLAESKIRESEQALRALMDNNPDLVCRLDRDSRHLYVNPALAKAHGKLIEDMLGKTNTELGVPPDKQDIWDKERLYVFDTGEPLQFEVEYLTAYGMRQLDIRLTPEFGEDGEVETVLSVARDVTDRKRSEQRKLDLSLEREKVALLREFLGDASHDLRTPLTTLGTSLYLLKRALVEPEPQARILTMELALSKMTSLLDNLFQMAQLDLKSDFHMQPVNVNSVVEEYVTMVLPTLQSKRQVLDLQLASDAMMMIGDPEYLSRAFGNLINNAVKYTPENGQIAISTRLEDGSIVICIQDTGIGISEEDLKAIFKRFFRADGVRKSQYTGNGLGLSIAKRVIDIHKGEIGVESELGSGSKFTVRLPAMKLEDEDTPLFD